MKTVNIGGDRLGSGNKMNVTMHGYERSNHDLSYLWKSTLSPGTLVPFMVQLALPGDTWDIDLNSIVRTNPTIGPLFGSFKLQLDVFQVPIRLYHSALHSNRLEIGTKMGLIKLPMVEVTGPKLDPNSDIPVEFQQINQSSILAYLGIRGLGYNETPEQDFVTRQFNAIPWIGYWDIVKNYYANKQEENAYYITTSAPTITGITINNVPANFPQVVNATDVIKIEGSNIAPSKLQVSTGGVSIPFEKWAIQIVEQWWQGTYTIVAHVNPVFAGLSVSEIIVNPANLYSDAIPMLQAVPLSNIDSFRQTLLAYPWQSQYIINDSTTEPFSYPLTTIDEYGRMNALYPQMGLAIKTYQSDIFNNWIQTDWIEGAGSIADVTKVSTAGNVLYLDALNIAKKVYDMLNRIAISGGTYQDWLEATYDHESKWRAETPMYCGGLSKEIVFQEVVSTAAQDGEPLGSLAGKGIMTDKHKGGHIIINVDEPSYIMGIVSITPRISYSQGNDWHVTTIKTLDDLHKPAMDGIGFQDLITDQMAFFGTMCKEDGSQTFNSAGKQPAWINYMTNFDRNYGNFADPRSQQFMTLDRRYEYSSDGTYITGIKDVTTYIDPAKFNYAFAQTSLDSMNFWVQISSNINARRKMSAKIIPNL